MKCPYRSMCKGRRRNCPGPETKGQWENCGLKSDVDEFLNRKLIVLEGMEKASGIERIRGIQ